MKALTTIIATFALLTIVACSGNDDQPAMDHSDHSQAKQTMASDTMHDMGADSMHTMAMDTSWACPMKCVAPQKAAGRCPECGMNLKMQVTAVTDSTNSAPMDNDHSGHTH
jgi:hypothetical protein